MKAVVFHGIGDIRLDSVKEPKLKEPTDAIVRLTASAICGTDLHMIRGTMPGMKPGTILGHEGVGVVEEVGEGVRNLQRGRPRGHPLHHRLRQLLLLPRAATSRSATTANPNGPLAGTAFFGGPEPSGPFHGLQAEKARVPFANVGPGQAARRGHATSRRSCSRTSSPPRYFGAEHGRDQARRHGGRVRLRARWASSPSPARSCWARAASSPSTAIADRLEMARAQGAEIIDFNAGGPGGGAPPAHRRHRRGPRHRRGGRGRRRARTRARRRRRPRSEAARSSSAS